MPDKLFLNISLIHSKLNSKKKEIPDVKNRKEPTVVSGSMMGEYNPQRNAS